MSACVNWAELVGWVIAAIGVVMILLSVFRMGYYAGKNEEPDA